MDTAVGLVKSYLELCGYFVLAELPVRALGEAGQGYRDVTDLDVVAVRFPHPPYELSGRDERPLEVFLGANPALVSFTQGLNIIIGEVKEGKGRLNPALRQALPGQAGSFRRPGCGILRGVHTVPLAHCMDFIKQRLLEGCDVLVGAQFKDPVLGLLALQTKLEGLARREAQPSASSQVEFN